MPRASRSIIHVAECGLHPNGGMGRVAWHWQKAFEARDYRFVHLGPAEMGPLKHPSHFPREARRCYERLGHPADVLLVHEPASGAFLESKDKLFVVSHGLERRYWEMQRGGRYVDLAPLRLKTRLLFPWWRLAPGERGLRAARGVLLINEEDRVFARQHYGRRDDTTLVFKNGVDALGADGSPRSMEASRTVLFLGSWIDRKGIKTLARTAAALHAKGVTLRWLLAGTGKAEADVLRDWPAELWESTEVTDTFDPAREREWYHRAEVFVLPSVFEGQPLSLLQAMAAGCCCITTDNCGQKDLIQHGRNGLLFQAGDFETLASLVEMAVHNAVLRHELEDRARLTVANRDWPAVSSEVVDFVEKALASR